jgi:hypothetical protein
MHFFIKPLSRLSLAVKNKLVFGELINGDILRPDAPISHGCGWLS